MLKSMFVAPDPGRLRLRGATRAVLGISLAVAACALIGHTLVAAIIAGLAALLALFTVTDTTVRGQAVTTALLPVVGFPVLALAALLHDYPVARDLAFLAVMGAGVYARRWGPRGHSLGVFAFMTFFAAQFLHTEPAQLPDLYEAIGIALLASSTVRFGLWCYERHLTPPVALALAERRGLARATTRQAVQATLGGGVALLVGHQLSGDRWYWAIGATWWIFVNTVSRGETLVRGFRRVLGTLIGIAVGAVVVLPLHGALVPTTVLVAVCVFGIFYTAAVSYTWMMLSVTVMAGGLYGLLGVLDPGLLALRLLETAAGALGALVAVLLVLPVTTHDTTNAWIERAVRTVHACTREAAARLSGSATADPTPHIAELEMTLARVRLSLAPLVHPLSPLRTRRTRAHQVIALLDECAGQVRGLTAIAADPEASYDDRLAAACARVEAAVAALIASEEALAGEAVPATGRHAGVTEPALAHLHRLEHALIELATPVRSAPRRWLIGA